MTTVLDFWDFFWIIWIVLVFSGWATAYSYARPSYLRRLRRLEAKLDLVLKHLNLEYREPSPGADLSEEVKSLAAQPGRKIEAIQRYREQTGAGLRQAKVAVDTFLRERK